MKTDDINDQAVTTKKIHNGDVTNEKLAGDSVTTDKIKDESVTTEKLATSAVDTDKIKEGAVTNDKLADDAVTIGKLDPELRETINAATGLPEELVKTIQDVDVNLAKLNDTVYPITLNLTVMPNVNTMSTTVAFAVASDGKPFVPDTLAVTKSFNGKKSVIYNTAGSNGQASTPIESNTEKFELEVAKQGRTGKSTSTTRYLCYYGGNPATSMTAELLGSLTKVSTTGVSFNPRITTKDDDYIWLVVPSDLTIKRVTSAGFDVTLSASSAFITNSLGAFVAYRTANPLTANVWSLVIS